jgi:potassium efflux system protein
VVPLGSYSIDLVSVAEHAFFGFQVGEITISLSSILLALTLFSAVMVVTTLVRGWIRNTLLPRTTLDSGLQNSIATMIGYAGVLLASAIGLFQIGLNLQNFAIVAGALSLGIGFGLQSIVSNFVSGLILLAERPIRVGDIIAVAGEEGFVRRISVRATEIETYDRATLIIPNSQLITGVVKNWVYGNTWSRVRVTLDVGYDSDVDAVRLAMLAAAEDDPRILPSPPPRVFLSKLGNASLEFELVAIVTSVETLPAVKSDLHLRVLKNFRDKGIRVAAQLPAAPAPVVVSLDEALGAVAAAKLRGEAAGKQA